MSSPIEQAIRQICDEKGLSYESVLATIQTALAAAYRKDFGEKNQNVEVEFDPESGKIRAFDVKTVVEDISDEELEAIHQEEVARKEALTALPPGAEIPAELMPKPEDEQKRFNPKTDIMLKQAVLVDDEAELGQVLRLELIVPGAFGRMAAQTAKQVITQKLRESEREIVYAEFKDQVGQVLMGTVQRREGHIVLVDVGRTTAVMRSEDQVPSERYNPGDRMKVYLRAVELGTRGPEILVSRASEELVRALFETEIPEIGDGSVTIKGLAREAGSRSKVAVFTTDDAIDPIGACIWQRGTHIQTIIAEIGGEKIDIVEWSDDLKTYITNALSPAKVQRVELNAEEKSAVVKVAADQLSLAIGRGGQNGRLAAKLTEWKINIAGEEVVAEQQTELEKSDEGTPNDSAT